MVALAESRTPDQAAGARGGSGAGARILVIEDDKGLARVIQRKLRRHNFHFESTPSPLVARELLDVFLPDLLLLDLDTASSDALALISEIRMLAAVPIIVLSSRADERAAVAALERGADDFLAKPFGLDELVARIRVGLRHVAKPERGTDPVIRIGELQLNVERRQVFRDGQTVHVTPTEYRLLKLIATHPDRFLPDRWLMDEIWGPAWRGGEHILHVYVGRLRRKLEPDPTCPRYLVTESGVGYHFRPDGR
jgi:two-component system, OmpR family, KDP operon response regulator KdpE